MVNVQETPFVTPPYVTRGNLSPPISARLYIKSWANVYVAFFVTGASVIRCPVKPANPPPAPERPL